MSAGDNRVDAMFRITRETVMRVVERFSKEVERAGGSPAETPALVLSVMAEIVVLTSPRASLASNVAKMHEAFDAGVEHYAAEIPPDEQGSPGPLAAGPGRPG